MHFVFFDYYTYHLGGGYWAGLGLHVNGSGRAGPKIVEWRAGQTRPKSFLAGR